MNVPERGILWLSEEKISRLPYGQLVFFLPSAEHPFASVTRGVHRANKLQTAIIRIKKKYRLMTLNDRHIKKSSFTPSPAQTALKKVAMVVVTVLGAVVGLIMWAILRPIFRGVGWVISIVTAALIIVWLAMNF